MRFAYNTYIKNNCRSNNKVPSSRDMFFFFFIHFAALYEKKRRKKNSSHGILCPKLPVFIYLSMHHTSMRNSSWLFYFLWLQRPWFNTGNIYFMGYTTMIPQEWRFEVIIWACNNVWKDFRLFSFSLFQFRCFLNALDRWPSLEVR